MAKIRIASDGSIIKDDVLVESNKNKSNIREDGTIVRRDINNSNNSRARSVNSPPVSPLERVNVTNTTNRTTNTSNNLNQTTIVNTSNSDNGLERKSLKELEYDLLVLDARIRGAVPRSAVFATIFFIIFSFIGFYILFLPAMVTSLLIWAGMTKKKELETEKIKLMKQIEKKKAG